MNPEVIQQGLRDVKGPVEYPAFPWLIVIVILGVLCVVVFLWLWQKRQKERVIEEPQEPPVPAHEVALAQLAQLERKPYLKNGEWDEFYSQLSTIVRHYIEARFNIRAPEMTTEEFLESLKKSSQLQEEHKTHLKGFCESCDMVKFAKFTPLITDAQNSLDLAKAFIQETHV